MKRVIYLLITAFIVLFVSCNDVEKPDPEDELSLVVAEGTIIHSGTKKPVEGVRVSLYDNVNYNTIFEIDYTDSLGFFHLEIHSNIPLLSLSKKGYSFTYNYYGAALGVVPLTTGEHKGLEFEIDASAYFDPVFASKVINPDIKVKFSDYAIDSYTIEHGIESTTYWSFSGAEPYRPYEGYPMTVVGDKYHLYMMEITGDGGKTTLLDSVYIVSFITFTDTIWY